MAFNGKLIVDTSLGGEYTCENVLIKKCTVTVCVCVGGGDIHYYCFLSHCATNHDRNCMGSMS